MNIDGAEFNKYIERFAGHVRPDQYNQLILTFNIDGKIYYGQYDGVSFKLVGYNGEVNGSQIVNVEWGDFLSKIQGSKITDSKDKNQENGLKLK